MDSTFIPVSDIAQALYSYAKIWAKEDADGQIPCQVLLDLAERFQLALAVETDAAAFIGMAYRNGWRFDPEDATDTDTLRDGWTHFPDRAF